MAREKPVAFELFSSEGAPGTPYYDNFINFWGRGSICNHYRSEPAYQKFQKVAPDLDARITASMRSLSSKNHQTLLPFARDLYKAYRIMRRYV